MNADERIARQAQLKPIEDIAAAYGIRADHFDAYGPYQGKIRPEFLKAPQKPGKLVLVSAISPTPAGEGKTTVTIGLADALQLLGQKSVVALREPSLGPVFGMKGGAAGGGYAQIAPMEQINLHFTGDLHAIASANNLLAALLDNHLFHGNTLNIHPKKIMWKRALDMNDRQLRHVISGVGRAGDGVMHEDEFTITAASEVMAILCLAEDMNDLKQRLARIVVAYDRDERPVYARQLNAVGAMAALLSKALCPNIVQTLGGTLALVHGGPFANIAHGCNSLLATRLALAWGDVAVTEAGFGADLGAEKFCNIKCRSSGLRADAAVITASVRALKYNGGAALADVAQENLKILRAGLPNLMRHIHNLRDELALPTVVAINRFPNDTSAELEEVQRACAEQGVQAVVCEVWGKGGAGGVDLGHAVLQLLKQPAELHLTYADTDTLEEKIQAVARKIYAADGVVFNEVARKDLVRLTALGYGDLPVCMAKTQYSFSDDPKLLGAPQGFYIHVCGLELAAGAGFVVVLCGAMMRMPGLPKRPCAEQIDVDEQGHISGLF